MLSAIKPLADSIAAKDQRDICLINPENLRYIALTLPLFNIEANDLCLHFFCDYTTVSVNLYIISL